MQRLTTTLLTLLLSAILTSPAAAQSSAIGFQAKLTGVADGPHTMTFSLYDVETAGAPLQTIGPQSVMVDNGIISTAIAFDPVHWNGQERWVGISIDGGVEEVARVPSMSVPFALNSRGIFGTSTHEIDRLGPLDSSIRVGTSSYDAGAKAGMTFDTGNRTAGAIVVEKQQGFGPYGTVEDNWMRFYLTRDEKPEAIERMTISHIGHVGIGTSVPRRRLTVGSTTDDIERMPAADEWLVIGTDNNVATTKVGLQFQTNSRTAGGIIIEKLSGSSIEDHRMRFFVTRENDLYSHEYMTIYETGLVSVHVLQITGGCDLAEPFDAVPTEANDISIEPAPGMVMTIDRDSDGRLVPATLAYDTAVAGVISGANGLSPGMVMGNDGDALTTGEHPLAMAGRVWVLADATFGPIRRGDRLTTSSTPGHAMRAEDSAKADGAVIGKAMTELAKDRGYVLVLVNLQ